jgi:hypothetical protein
MRQAKFDKRGNILNEIPDYDEPMLLEPRYEIDVALFNNLWRWRIEMSWETYKNPERYQQLKISTAQSAYAYSIKSEAIQAGKAFCKLNGLTLES